MDSEARRAASCSLCRRGGVEDAVAKTVRTSGSDSEEAEDCSSSAETEEAPERGRVAMKEAISAGSSSPSEVSDASESSESLGECRIGTVGGGGRELRLRRRCEMRRPEVIMCSSDEASERSEVTSIQLSETSLLVWP